MPPIFFATTPDAANRIEKDPGVKEVNVYARGETLSWINGVLDGAVDQNISSPGNAQPVPAKFDVEMFAMEAVSGGLALVSAEVENKKDLVALSKRTKTEIVPVIDLID